MAYDKTREINEITIKQTGFTVYFTDIWTDQDSEDVDKVPNNRQVAKFSELTPDEKQFITSRQS